MGRKRPPRLAGFEYVGKHRYFLTICTEGRFEAFADASDGQWILRKFLRAAEANGFVVIAYCVMPDHLHVLLEGIRPDADLRAFVRWWKQSTGFEWKRRTGQKLWQEGYFDRVLRPEESEILMVAYIATNPVRAGLATTLHEYPLFGCSYTPEQLREALEIALRTTG